MKMKKAMALAMAALMACLLFAACGGDAGSGGSGGTSTPGGTSAGTPAGGAASEDTPDTTAEYEEVVSIAYAADIETADPYGSTAGQTRSYTNSTFRTLTFNNYDTKELDLVLATSVEDVSGDNTAFEAKLRDDVTFHNGAKFTAADVEFTWNYAKDAANVVLVIPSADAMVKEVVVVDDYTVRFDLNYAIADFPTQLEVKIYSKEAFDTLPKEEAAVIGCGPYKHGEWKSGIEFTLEKFEDYYDTTAFHPTKRIVHKIIPEFSSQIAALEAGDVDCVSQTTAAQVPLVEANDSLILESRLALQPWILNFNNKKEQTKNDDFRKAIAYAVNRDDIVTIALNGGLGGQAAYNFCPPDAFGYVEVDGYKYDEAEAKSLIEASGYAGATLKLACYSLGKSTAEVLQAQFGAIGLNITIEEVNGADWTPYKKNNDWDLYIEYVGYSGALLYNYERYLHEGGTSNFTGYFNQDYEDLLTACKTAPTYEDMLTEFAVLQEWVAENVPFITLYVETLLGVRKDYVEGYRVGPNGSLQNYSTLRVPLVARK